MQHKLNNDAILGLAISTAFLRCGFTDDTTIYEVDAMSAWDEIEALAEDYLVWVGLKRGAVTVDKAAIAEAVWGLSE